jgi:hypothetical protein
MKKLLFTLLFANMCFAQGFIEVEVRDTLMMKPVAFVYEIALAERYNYDEPAPADTVAVAYEPEIAYARSKNDGKNAETRKINDLENFLKKNKYTYEPTKNYDIGNAYGYGIGHQKSFLVKLKNKQALDKLSTEVEKMEEWTGSISDIDYGNPENIEAELMQKLLKKAKTKAIMIAGMTEQKLGPIIEFRELKASDNLNYSVVDLILNTRKKSPRDFFKESLNGELSKTVIVRFKTL